MRFARYTREQWTWAWYDWANSAFATTVMAGFFPAFFRAYWSHSADVTLATERLGVANSVAGFVIALLAPLLGAMADRSARRKRAVLLFTLLGALATACLYLLASGQWLAAALLFTLATVGFNGGVVFYDALLLLVAPPRDYDRVSALGYALGYLGGGLLFLVNVIMTLHPTWFGLAGQAEAIRWSFVSVGAWWLLFTLPLMRGVREPPASVAGGGGGLFLASWRELMRTLGVLMQNRPLWLFLVAYWLYIDGVNTIIKMAVDYGMALGLPAASLLLALLLTQFVAFPAALLFGWLGDRIGARNGILAGLAVYLGITVWAIWLDSVAEFFAIAVAVGLVQGGVQSLSRSLFGRFVPPGKSAEYFGFYNMLGKFATVFGPLLIAASAALTGSSRASIGSLLLLFGAGMLLLWRVRVPAGSSAAGP